MMPPLMFTFLRISLFCERNGVREWGDPCYWSPPSRSSWVPLNGFLKRMQQKIECTFHNWVKKIDFQLANHFYFYLRTPPPPQLSVLNEENCHVGKPSWHNTESSMWSQPMRNWVCQQPGREYGTTLCLNWTLTCCPDLDCSLCKHPEGETSIWPWLHFDSQNLI